MMLKLKLQYFSHLMRRVDSLEKTLMLGGLGAGGEGDDRERDGWMASLTQRTWVWVNSGVGDGQRGLVWCNSWGYQRVGHDWLNWTECISVKFLIKMSVLWLCKIIFFLIGNAFNYLRYCNIISDWTELNWTLSATYSQKF